MKATPEQFQAARERELWRDYWRATERAANGGRYMDRMTALHCKSALKDCGAWQRWESRRAEFRASMAAHATVSPGELTAGTIAAARANDERREAARAARKGRPLPYPLAESERRTRAAEAAAPVACQPANISSTHQTGLPVIEAGAEKAPNRAAAYYNRKAIEVETNVEAAIERWGIDYTLEFTITLRPGVAKEASAKEFSKSWNAFLHKWLRKQWWFNGEWVRVNEATKAGVVHAHVICRTNASVRRPGVRLKWYKTRYGGQQVDGRTVAPWLRDAWAELRGEKGGKFGALMRKGLGNQHTLQPIRTTGRQVGRYIAKYIRKALTERPAHLKHVRLVNYSQTFERIARATITENRINPAAEKIKYLSFQPFEFRPAFDLLQQLRPPLTGRPVQRKGKLGELVVKERWRAFIGFDLDSNSTRLRRAAMPRVAEMLGAQDYGDFQMLLGKHWAYYLLPMAALVPQVDYIRPTNWKAIAYARGICQYGAINAIYRYKGKLYGQAAFDRIPPAERTKEGWEFVEWRDAQGAPIDDTELFDLTSHALDAYAERAREKIKKRSDEWENSEIMLN